MTTTVKLMAPVVFFDQAERCSYVWSSRRHDSLNSLHLRGKVATVETSLDWDGRVLSPVPLGPKSLGDDSSFATYSTHSRPTVWQVSIANAGAHNEKCSTRQNEWSAMTKSAPTTRVFKKVLAVRRKFRRRYRRTSYHTIHKTESMNGRR